MITTTYKLVAVPRIFWENDTNLDGKPLALNGFVTDALGVERRLPKGVNLENERERYNLCCDRIESAIPPTSCRVLNDVAEFGSTFASNQIPAIVLSPEYLDLLTILQTASISEPAEVRIGASFFPPDTLASHIHGFEEIARQAGIQENVTVKRRSDFFRAADGYQCGIIESRHAFYSSASQSHPTLTLPYHETASSLELYGNDVDDAIDNTGTNLTDILRDELRKAIRSHESGHTAVVNFSNQPHNVITEVLNEFVFVNDRESGGTPVYVQVIYTDGSQGRPFPLRCLRRRPGSERQPLVNAPILRVALMSMRHQEMDRDVDMAWFRNRQVSKSRTLGETDEFCYAHSKQQLRDVFTDGSLRLYLYQTGFQPAVIGFYRALIEEIARGEKQPPVVQVVPYYFSRKNGYIAGSLWC